MEKRVSTSVGILIIVAIAIVLFRGALWLMQNVNIKNQNDNVKIENETAGWETYKNDKYGVEFKYPLTQFYNLQTNEAFNDVNLGKGTIFMESSVKGVTVDDIRFTAVASQYNLSEYEKNLNDRGQNITELKEVVIDGRKSYSFITGELQMGYYYETLTNVIPNNKNNSFLYFSITHGIPFEQKTTEYLSKEDTSLFNQIISTFKFTK